MEIFENMNKLIFLITIHFVCGVFCLTDLFHGLHDVKRIKSHIIGSRPVNGKKFKIYPNRQRPEKFENEIPMPLPTSSTTESHEMIDDAIRTTVDPIIPGIVYKLIFFFFHFLFK